MGVGDGLVESWRWAMGDWRWTGPRWAMANGKWADGRSVMVRDGELEKAEWELGRSQRRSFEQEATQGMKQG